MNSKKIFSLLLVLFGEALIITCFLYFGRNVQSEILGLNIVITSIIYSLLFLDILIPWVDFSDKSQKTIGSLGVRWFFTLLYIIVALVAMFMLNSTKPVSFYTQAIIQGIIFFFLLLGLLMAFSSSDKVKAVYAEEQNNRGRIDEMKKATKELQNKLAMLNNIPTDIISRVNDIQENLRFLSPSNNVEAIDLEDKFVNQIYVLSNCFTVESLDVDDVFSKIKNCELTYKERKQIFSN